MALRFGWSLRHFGISNCEQNALMSSIAADDVERLQVHGLGDFALGFQLIDEELSIESLLIDHLDRR